MEEDRVIRPTAWTASVRISEIVEWLCGNSLMVLTVLPYCRGDFVWWQTGGVAEYRLDLFEEGLCVDLNQLLSSLSLKEVDVPSCRLHLVRV